MEEKTGCLTEEGLRQLGDELDERFGLSDEDEPTDVPRPAQKVETAAERLARIEREVEKMRKQHKDAPSLENLQAVNAKQAEAADLRQRLKREEQVKEQYKRNFLQSFATDDDFEVAWRNWMRTEAMKQEAEKSLEMREAERHPLYGSL